MQQLYKKDDSPINLLQDSDIEFGSNENGFYEKHSNGTLIQWGTKLFDLKKWVRSGDSNFHYSDNHAVNFNIPFIGKYSVMAIPTNGNLIWVYCITQKNGSIANINLITFKDRNSDSLNNYEIQWIAIGRWK